MTEWWNAYQGNMGGGIGGGLIGVVGGTVGAAAGYFAPRGRFKSAIIGAMAGLILLGVALLIAGIIAVASRQPYHVWYPLVLGGGILSLVCGPLLPVLLVRYRQADQRRLDAAELRRG